MATSDRSQKQVLKIGLAQIAPVWLDRNETLQKVANWVEDAGKQQCDLVTFGETLAPGYPFWLDFTGGSKFNDNVQKDIFSRYLDQSIDISAGHLDPICKLAAKNQIMIVLGVFEKGVDRGGHTGYCSAVTIGKCGTVLNVHRKIMPTYEERLVWGAGDGHGLNVFPLGRFNVGALNCWENWLPLVRSALYAKGESLRVAIWPGCRRNTVDITRFVALESRSYVASVCGLLRPEDIPNNFPHRNIVLKNFPENLTDGGSAIAAPDGSWVIPPADEKEQLLTASIDYNNVLRERQNMDPCGHYSRPDITQLSLNQQRQSTLRILE